MLVVRGEQCAKRELDEPNVMCYGQSWARVTCILELLQRSNMR
jgi:hypothetical protein